MWRPVTLATSRGGKPCVKSVSWKLYRVKRMGLVQIMRDILPLRRGYPVR